LNRDRNAAPAKTAALHAAPPPDTAALQESKPANAGLSSLPAPTAGNTPSGRYTIYISRYRTQATADEESSRWRAAGYESQVTPRAGWYCVSIGRFPSRQEARALVDKLVDGFEGGYWITTAEE
jgi:septal ring-binding cell division protein DamX